MYRGTTPTITFALPFEASKIDVLSIAFAQKQTPYSKESTLVFEKKLADCTVEGKSILCELTEADTLQLRSDYDVDIQMRVKCAGKWLASKIYTKPVERILKDGCLL